MKKTIFLLLLSYIILSCCQKKETSTSFTPIDKQDMETAIIYEANIRQYSPEGTFDEFTKDIPQLKELGVKIIWLMPIFPISETKRKAFGDRFVTDLPEEERGKYLGSYYAVSDYTKINPEFGDIEDFRELLNTAHNNGMYVILDWVPNHTGWDHQWIQNHPEYYTKNTNGEITDPLNEEGVSVGWTDVADLNYANPDLRREMIEDMLFWVKEEGVDGFRCDVAGSVPTDFWAEAIPKLRKHKKLFMLAEAWEPELLHGSERFDMCYAWEGHHVINQLAKEKMTLADLKTYLEKMGTHYESDDILMNFVTNHDENSWNGTIEERLGEASELMTALIYTLPGMPLIYSGQEYDLKHRLKFFEKDSIPKTKGKTWGLLNKLGELKQTHPALNGGKHAAELDVLPSGNEDVLLFTRKKDDNLLTFVGNFSGEPQQINLSKGEHKDYISDVKVVIAEGEKLELGPWEYKILVD